MANPLSKIRVVDLSRLLPGPLCTLVLADLGAEVIKVEDPAGGDYLRFMPPLADDLSGAFHALNRNKRSASIDLKKPAGRELFLRLLRTADLLVDSFRPGTLEKLGLGPDLLATTNRRLIHVAISGYGETGPDKLRAGHDLNYQARAGLLSLSADGHPSEPSNHGPRLHAPHIQFADIAGGAFVGAISVLAALVAREQDGAGRRLDLSMTEGALYGATMLFGFTQAARRWARAGRETLTGELPCYNVYTTRDGKQVALAALEPKFWSTFCEAAGLNDLLPCGHDPSDDAFERVRAAFASRPASEWIALGETNDICLSDILTGDAIFSDRQHTARGAFATLDLGGTLLRLPAPPFRAICETSFVKAPSLGADNRSILRELGYTRHEIESLATSGVVGKA